MVKISRVINATITHESLKTNIYNTKTNNNNTDIIITKNTIITNNTNTTNNRHWN